MHFGVELVLGPTLRPRQLRGLIHHLRVFHRLLAQALLRLVGLDVPRRSARELVDKRHAALEVRRVCARHRPFRWPIVTICMLGDDYVDAFFVRLEARPILPELAVI